MRYKVPVHEFSFNKIKNGRRVGVHLLDKKCQNIKLRDVLELENMSTKEKIECVVKGFAIFENFDDLVDALTPEKLGYSNKEEVMLRLNRIYSKEQQEALNAIGIFFTPQLENLNIKFRDENER